MDRVIFACVHNAGRSQMAAAFLTAMANPERVEALSAGTQPADCVHLQVVTVMREIGIDLSHQRPQLLTAALVKDATVLITMGCGEECPYVPGVQRDDWPIADPKGLAVDDVRRVRDDVRGRVADLIQQRGWYF